MVEDGITSIGDYAFWGCSSMTAITIPNSVTSIGVHAFEGCGALTSITIPDSVKLIDGGAFYYCRGLTDITLPNSITSINVAVFYECDNLTNITLPENLTTIKEAAFYGCNSLTSITIPDSVTTIEKRAFQYCTSLTGIEVGAGNSNYCSVDGVLYSKDMKTLVCYPAGKTDAQSVTIPNGVVTIADYAFYGCASLTGVTIPASVTAIGSSAFYDCDGLTSITFPENLTTIGSSAFYSCNGLTSVTIPGNVETFEYAFQSCSNLTSVTILNGVGEISNSAFSSCSKLTNITIPNSVRSIGASAFYECSGLRSINIPNGITELNQRTFYNCTALSSVTVPASVNTIDQRAFYGCSSLTRVTLENGDLKINGSYSSQTLAFYNCIWLQEVTVGSEVNTLTRTVLYNMGRSSGGLTDISFRGPNYFGYTGDNHTIGKLTMTEGAYYVDGKGVLYRLNNDGTAAVVYVPVDLVQYEIASTIPAEDGSMTYTVTVIGDSAFRDCAALTAVTIPDSITSIGHHAFRSSSNLTQVTLPTNLTSLGGFAFYDCGSLARVNGENSISAVIQAWVAVGANTTTFQNSALSGQADMITTDDIEITDSDGLKVVISTKGTHALTGQEVQTTLTVSGGQDSTNVVRVYFQFASEYGSINHSVGPYDFDGVRVEVCKANVPNTYYLEIKALNAGQVWNLKDLTSTYKTAVSGGGSALIWVDILSKDEVSALGNGVTVPEKAHKVTWTTQPNTMQVINEVYHTSPTLVGDGTENSEIPLKDLAYTVQISCIGEPAKFGQDPVVSVDFVNTLTLPVGFHWREGIIDAIRSGNGRVTGTDRNYRFYVTVGYTDYELAYLQTDYALGNAKDLKLAVVDDKIQIYWTCHTLDITAETPAFYGYVKLGNNVILADLGEIEKAVPNTYDFNSTVNATLHFSYSADQTHEATAIRSISIGAADYTMDNSFYGSSYEWGESIPYYKTLKNNGVVPYTDLNYVTTSPPKENYYITPEDMEIMFYDDPYGEYLSITISSATLCCREESNAVTGTDGEEHVLSPQFEGKKPPHDGKATTGCINCTNDVTMTIGWKDDELVLKVGERSYTISRGSLRDTMDSIGFVVTSATQYTCRWNQKGQTLYSGEQRRFDLRTTLKDAFMRLNQDGTSFGSGSSYTYFYVYSNDNSRKYAYCYANISRDFWLTKDVYLDGAEVTAETPVKAGDVLTYQTVVTHKGDAAYEALPLVDHMEGPQLLLVSVIDNPHLAGKNLGTTEVNGKDYYILDVADTYDNIMVGDYLADRVVVEKVVNNLETMIYWYLTDVNGDATVTVEYQTLVSPAHDGFEIEGETYTLSNEVWLNDHQTHRMYDQTIAYGVVLAGMDKYIVTNLTEETVVLPGHDPSEDALTKHSIVSAGQSVTYRLAMETAGSKPCTISGDSVFDALPASLDGYWVKDKNVTVTYVTGEESSVDGVSWDIETDAEDPSQQYIRWKGDFTVQGTLYIYVTLTYPTGEQWEKYCDAYGSTGLHNTFQVFRGRDEVSHLVFVQGKALLQKGVIQTGLTYQWSTYTTQSWTNPHEDSLFCYNNAAMFNRYLTYSITLYNSGISRLYLSDIQDVLPEGFNYWDSVSSTSSSTMMIDGAVFKSASVKATTAEDSPMVTFSLSGGNLCYDEHFGKYYLNSGEAVVITYRCKTDGYSAIPNEITGAAAMPFFDYSGAGTEIDRTINVDRKNKEGKISNNGSRELVTGDAAAWGMDTTGQDDSTQWLASRVTIKRGDIQLGIQMTAEELYADVDETITWLIKVSNSGAGDMSGYTLTDVMMKPYQFTGTVSYRIDYDYDTSIYAICSNLFTFGEREGDRIKITSGSGESATLTIDGGYQNLPTTLRVYNPPYFYDASITIQVSLSRDANGNEVLSVFFPEDSAYRANIPALGSATMTLQTQNFTGIYSNTSIYNTAYVTPTQSFDHDKVTDGNYIVYNGADSVGSSDSVAVSYGYYTTASTAVTEKGDTSNSAASDDTQKYIVLYNAASDFRYTLSVDNTSGSTGSQAMDMLVFINNLPQLGDHATFHPEILRFSEFQVNFCETPEFVVCVNNDELAEEAYTLQFSKATEFSENDMNGTSTDGWYTLDQLKENGLSVTEMRSFRVVILDDSTGDEHLMPAEAEITVSFNAQADLSEGDIVPSSVAWNSFGYYYSLKDDSMELSASSQNVGVRTATIPCLVKELQDTDGNSFSAKEDTAFRFVIYEGEAITLPDTYTQEEVFTALTNSTYSVVELTVKAGESTSDRLDLGNLYCYRYENGSLVQTDAAWVWKNTESYTILELPADSIYQFASFNEENTNNYTFTYDPLVSQRVTCLNVCNLWDIQLQKQCQLTAEPLAGAVFGLYSPAAVDRISDERFGTLTAQLENAPQKTVEVDGRTWYLMDIRTTDDEGLILWNDLSEKQYYLLELQAPTGYHPNKQPGQVIQAVDEIAMIIVTNAPCYELPDSGGMGTTVFYAAGAVMTGFSLLMGWNKKHKTRKTTAK